MVPIPRAIWPTSVNDSEVLSADVLGDPEESTLPSWMTMVGPLSVFHSANVSCV